MAVNHNKTTSISTGKILQQIRHKFAYHFA